MKKPTLICIFLIIIYVFLFFIQINQPPFERFPNWDAFWGNVLQAGKLYALKFSLLGFELPAINPYIGFGWNNIGDTSLPQSFVFPLNLLILIFPPDIVLMIRLIILLILGGIGAYLYLNFLTRDNFISFLGGLTYISVPFVISISNYYAILNTICLIPLTLLLIHKILEQEKTKKIILFIALSILAVSSGDVFVFIIVPAVVGIYSLFIASGFYNFSLYNSFKKTLKLIFLFFLSSSFYLVPLYYNLKTISNAQQSLIEAGLTLTSTSIGVRGFLAFFYKHGFLCLFLPNEGSGLLLYIPAFFYFSFIIALIFKRVIFNKESKQALISFTLFLIGLTMFLISILYYSFPELAKSGKGVLRSQINLFPFLNVLAGFICFSAIIRLSKLKKKIIFASIILCSCAVDFYLFVVHHRVTEWYLFNIRTRLTERFLHSSNLIGVRFMKNMWPFLLLINLLFIILLLFYSIYNKSYIAKKRIYVAFMVSAMVLPLLNISVHNELRLQQDHWQIVFRDPYRGKSYLERRECINSIIDRHDINYRTLYVGKDIFGGSGRNWKLIAETELNIQEREKALFSFRETMHPYTALLYSRLSGEGYFKMSDLSPPVSNKIALNIDEVIKFMGVKYIISTDEKIESPSLIYRGECITKDSIAIEITGPDGGITYVYELKEPVGIAFLVDHYKKVSLTQSVATIFENRIHPWINNEVYLEEDPINDNKSDKNDLRKSSYLIESSAKIVREKFNEIQLNISTPKEKFLILSYIYRPNWKAFIGSKKLKIYRAYGGFMCIKVPPGNSTVKFKYTPIDVYFGIFLTLFAFLIPFLPHFFRFLKQKSQERLKVFRLISHD
jgi:hypothetical protein